MRWQPAIRRGYGFWQEAGLYTALFLFLGFEGRHSENALEWVGPWLVMMPMMDGMSLLNGRSRRTLWEIVRPVGRREFFLEFGAVVLLNMLRAWAAVWMAAAVSAVIMRLGGYVVTGNVAQVIAVSLAAQVSYFGFVVWGIRFRSESGRAVAVAAGVVASMGAGIVLLNVPPFASLIAVPVMFGVGAVLATIAYQGWLETDLD